MGTSEKMLRGVYNLRRTSIPSRGRSNTPSRLPAKETGISSRRAVGQFGLSAALPLALKVQFYAKLYKQ